MRRYAGSIVGDANFKISRSGDLGQREAFYDEKVYFPSRFMNSF